MFFAASGRADRRHRVRLRLVPSTSEKPFPGQPWKDPLGTLDVCMYDAYCVVSGALGARGRGTHGGRAVPLTFNDVVPFRAS